MLFLMDTNLSRTFEKSVFDVNRILCNYSLTRLRMLSTRSSIGFIVLLSNTTRFTLPLSLYRHTNVNTRAWHSTQCSANLNCLQFREYV